MAACKPSSRDDCLEGRQLKAMKQVARYPLNLVVILIRGRQRRPLQPGRRDQAADPFRVSFFRAISYSAGLKRQMQ